MVRMILGSMEPNRGPGEGHYSLILIYISGNSNVFNATSHLGLD